MTNCQGCGHKGLKRSGINLHCCRSHDPCLEMCNHPTTSEVPDPANSISKERTVQMTFIDNIVSSSSENVAFVPEDQMRDIPYLSSEGVVNSDGSPDIDSDDDADEIAARNAEAENGLEPRRHTRCLGPIDPTAMDNVDMGRTPTPDNDELWKRREAEQDLERCPFVTRYPGGMAGAVHSKADLGENQKYGLRIGEESQENIYTPFVSQLDWEVARWAKFRGPSSNSFTELMAIDGVNKRLGLSFKNTRELNKVIDTHLPGRPPFQRKEILVGDEVCELYFQDIIQCICTLFWDPDFTPYLIFAPERHYTDEDQEEMVYHDMYTGQWWWFTQVAIEKDAPGATIVPVLISTDKTQLTPFQNKCAYPIYMTIGNIPKEICRKTSMHAYVLLGYLPTTKLKQEKNQAKRKHLIANLYHACLQHILEPLITAGNDGVFMSTASGDVHCVHPILASFIGDYPEQVLTTCTLTGDCPRCGMTTDNLGNFDPDDMPAPCSLGEFVNVLGSFHRDPAGFLQASSQICAKPGIIKYLKAWILSACEPSEIDARCHRLDCAHFF
ncbi:hypothetical protein V8E53_012389 [Lactarius tabidus]